MSYPPPHFRQVQARRWANMAPMRAPLLARTGRFVRRCAVSARWAAGPWPSWRQLACLLVVSAVLSLATVRFLVRPYPELTAIRAFDDYMILTHLDARHACMDALGYFVGDWPEGNGFYRPLTGVSLWLDYRFWHWNPYGYRLTNWVLYVCTGAMLALLLGQITRRRWAALGVLAAFMLAPLRGNQCALSYFNARGELLCALSVLSALYAALRYCSGGKRRWLGLAVVGLVAGLWSKELAMVLPLLLVACLPAALKRARPARRVLGRAVLVEVLWALLLVGWYFLYVHSVPGRMPTPGGPRPHPIPSTPYMILGAILPDLQIMATWLHAGPDVGCIFVPFWQTMAWHLALWLVAMVWLARREWQALALYLVWAPITWLPMVGTHTAAEHYLYLPEMGRTVAFGVVAGLALAAWQRRRRA